MRKGGRTDEKVGDLARERGRKTRVDGREKRRKKRGTT
jgi:hypothetical protein